VQVVCDGETTRSNELGVLQMTMREKKVNKNTVFSAERGVESKRLDYWPKWKIEKSG